MRHFVGQIRSGIGDDVEKLVKSSLVILAVKQSMEEGGEVKVRDIV